MLLIANKNNTVKDKIMYDENKVINDLANLTVMVSDLLEDRKELIELKQIVYKHTTMLNDYLNNVNLEEIKEDVNELVETTNEFKEIIKQNERPDKWDKLIFSLIAIVAVFAFYTRS